MKAYFSFLLILVVISCHSSQTLNPSIRKEPTSRDVWTTALQTCANDDLLSKQQKKLLFLGLSNPYGPGSCWRPSDANFEPRWNLAEAVPDSKKQAEFITKGITNPCSTTASIDNVTKINTLVGLTILPVSLTNTLDISRAKSVTAQFISWRKDYLNELYFETWAQNKQESGMYGQDLLMTSTGASGTPNKLRYVLKSAIWVEGFKMAVTFSKGYLDTLEAKGDIKKVLNINNNLTLKRSSANQVEFSSESGFYIVATLIPINNGALGAITGDMFKPEENISPQAQALQKPVHN